MTKTCWSKITVLLGKPVACLIATLLVCGAAAPAQAEAILTYDSSQAGGERADGPFTIGTLFRVGGTPINITHLGAQDADAASDAQDPDGADGLTGFADDDGFFNGPISVGLWNANGTTQLGTASVSSTDVVIDSWRYAPIDQGPLTLQANTDYLLGAFVGGGIEWFIDDTAAPTAFGPDNGVTILENRFLSGSFGAPLSNGGAPLGRWGAANAIQIPEPASIAIWALLGSAMALFAWRKRSHRSVR